MPILLILILAVIIAQVGFWKTLGAILGAVAMVVLLIFLAIVAMALIAALMMRRAGRQYPGRRY